MPNLRPLTARTVDELDHFEREFDRAWNDDGAISFAERTHLKDLFRERVKPTAIAARDAKAFAQANEHGALTPRRVRPLFEQFMASLERLPEPLDAA